MGLFSRLFGGKTKEEEERERLLEQIKELTAGACEGESSLRALDEALPDPKDVDLKLEIINMLSEMDRDDWAEGLIHALAHDEDCPLPVLKGLLRHYLNENRIGEVTAPVKRMLAERPSESEIAAALGRYRLGEEDYEAVLKEMADPLKAAPDSMYLFAIVGECHFRRGEHEAAVTHLRAACELYEQAFRRGEVLAEEMQAEQLEFSRLYGMLEDAARHHLGADRVHEAFETIHMEPSGFGIQKEAERLAADRKDYTPISTELLTQECLGEEAQKAEDQFDSHAISRMLAGEKALRELDYTEAMRLFRESLELDGRCFGSYFGWAASEMIQRVPEFPGALPEEPTEDEWKAWEKLCPDLPVMTGLERRIVRAAVEPIANFHAQMIRQKATARVHLLDVRLSDIYPKPVEARFEFDGTNPKAVGAFATKLQAHTRLDEFLALRPEHFRFARQFGYMIADSLTPRERNKAEDLMKKARQHTLPGQGQRIANLDEFIATTYEGLCLSRLFGAAEDNEYFKIWKEVGVFEYFEKLRS
ncbi:hypothetical protein KQI84_07605 [bacterium]|nr:hypothetical protein [bacterium]